MRITVLGAGAWGTALAKILQENGNAVTLWDKDANLLAQLQHGFSLFRGVRLDVAGLVADEQRLSFSQLFQNCFEMFCASQDFIVCN